MIYRTDETADIDERSSYHFELIRETEKLKKWLYSDLFLFLSGGTHVPIQTRADRTGVREHQSPCTLRSVQHHNNCTTCPFYNTKSEINSINKIVTFMPRCFAFFCSILKFISCNFLQVICRTVMPSSQAWAHKAALGGAEIVAINNIKIT